MRLLFHCCCAPCATACVENLAADNVTPTLFWYNPNIHPYTEYQNRKDALIAFAATGNLPLETADEYGLRPFLQSVGCDASVPERCEICYRLRLEKTVAYAAEHGFDAFGTSLLISPYQQHDTIRRIGEETAAKHGVQFFYRDFRPLFRQGQTRARTLGLYMQKYCGCIFSEEERYTKPDKHNVQTHPQLQTTNYQLPTKFQRLALITGTEVLEKLSSTNVLVFGLGGVGSWCAEALARSGVGKIGIVDFDTVCESNVNRQVQATSRTIGLSKADVLKQRLLEINPGCEVTAWNKIFSRENAAVFGIEKAGYVIDAIDSLIHKLDLIETSYNSGVKLFSSMGMALKIDPTRIRTGDIWETQGCALARLVRQGLRKRGFNGNFTVVYSEERLERRGETAAGDTNSIVRRESGEVNRMSPQSGDADTDGGENNPLGKKIINGSVVTVTAAAGMTLASLVLRDIMGY